MKTYALTTLCLSGVLLICTGCSNIDNLSCVYIPQPSDTNPHPQLSPFKSCAHFNEIGSLILAKDHLNNLYYDENNLASVRLTGAIYYVHKSGATAQTHYIDNGPDYFSHGLARYINKGKYGFIDKELNITIPATYDYAAPFENGLAVVCNQCIQSKRGGHTEMTGGLWGYIDKSGKEVVSVEFEKDKLILPKTGESG